MSTDHSSTNSQLDDSELELLSRSMDEDLSEFELKRLSKNILSKDEAAQTWARYHAVSAVMNKQFPAQLEKDFSSQVMQAITADETQVVSSSNKSGFGGAVKSYVKQFTGLAVAASVAAVSIVVYQQQTQPGLLEGGAESSIIISDKRDISDFQPNSAASVENLPVEFSPVQPGVKDDIITLDDEYQLSRSPSQQDDEAELDIIELEDIQP